MAARARGHALHSIGLLAQERRDLQVVHAAGGQRVHARRIGEQEEYERCVLFLLEASEEGYVELARSRPLSL